MSNAYRYGFNGKENDNEVKGAGNQQDYGMRIYNPRIGKFLSVDPLTKQYSSLTPYQFASNSPIAMIDVDGMEGNPYQMMQNQQSIRKYETDLRKSNPKHADGIIKQHNVNAFLSVGSMLTAGSSSLFSIFINGVVDYGAYQTVKGIIKKDDKRVAEGTHLMVWGISGEVGGMVLGKSFEALSPLLQSSKSTSKILTVLEEDGFAVIRNSEGKAVGKGWLSGSGEELNFTIKTKGTELEGQGGNVFTSIMKYIEKNWDKIGSIRGNWKAGPLGDNLDTFNKLVNQGKSLEDAALGTFTGKLAQKNGFGKAVIENTIKDSKGNYTGVDVIFKRK